jgi:hypothetical protein
MNGSGGHGGSQIDSSSVSDGGTPSLAITSPGSPAYTNKSVEVTISVTGDTAASRSVQLLENGTLLSTISGPPYDFKWDTAAVDEGSYQLVAQMDVAGQIIASVPVTIIVDRTPPTIVSRSPDSGATNVSLTNPIQVVFSEALAPANVTASAVTLALGSTAVGATAALGTDGKTVSVSIANLASLALPGTMTENATSAITDLAGNAFAGASWNFAVPLWVDLGTVSGGMPQMVLDSSGVPIVATIATSGSTSQLLIGKHVSGTTWDTTSIPSPQIQTTVTEFSLAIDKSNALFLAWDEVYASGVATPILVARWGGTTWDRRYGQLLQMAGGAAERPAIAVTGDGSPVVRWAELVFIASGPDYVARWNGTAWTPLAGGLSGDCDILPCRIVLDSSDDPVIETNGQISRWTGSSWTAPVGGGDGMAVNSSQLVVTTQNGGTTIQVVGISSTGTEANYVPALGTSPVQTEGLSYGQIAVDGSDEPVIVWFQFDGGTTANPTNPNLHVARWTGAAWDQGYGMLDNASGFSALVLAQDTTPIVAWGDASQTTVHISKSNH